MNCPNCNAQLPDDAQFCIECGKAVSPASTGATVKLAGPAWDVACPHCGAANPTVARFCINCGGALPGAPPPPAQDVSPELWLWIAGFFLFGLGLLWLTRSFVPGIFVLIGLTGLIGGIAARRPWAGLQSLVWMFGLVFLFANPRLLVPGLLVLLCLSALLGLLLKPHRRVW